MTLEYTIHWFKKKKELPGITDDLIEYCVQHSPRIKDRNRSNLFNAIARVPSSGRLLKVVYKPKGKTIKVITAFWLK